MTLHARFSVLCAACLLSGLGKAAWPSGTESWMLLQWWQVESRDPVD